MLGEYTNLHNKAEAQKIQMSAVSDNRRVLKPIDGIQYHKITGDIFDQAVSCSNYLLSTHTDPNGLIIEVNAILDAFKFKKNTSNGFEESFKLIAPYLGFDSQRPEQEYKKGPDVLWKMGELKFLVIECKNEAATTTISKDYCNQLNGSCLWFTDKYDTSCSYTPIMVHPSTLFEHAASPEPAIRIITKEKLRIYCNAVRDFIKSVASKNELGNPEAIREKLIAYELRASDIVEKFTESFYRKNQP